MSVFKRFRTSACVLIIGAGISIAVPTMAGAAPGQGKGKANPHKVQGDGKGNGKPHEVEARGNARSPKDTVKEAEAFDNDRDYYTARTRTAGDAVIINRYFSTQGLPPGLAVKPLPPGLRKQLQERGQLPPGLQSRLVAVPGPLGSQLTPLAPYFSRYLLGRDLVVIDTRSNRVAVIRGNVITLR